jgi:hypothetical protein
MVYAIPDLDASLEWAGVNVVVVGYAHNFSLDEAGSVQWRTTLSVREVVL